MQRKSKAEKQNLNKSCRSGKPKLGKEVKLSLFAYEMILKTLKTPIKQMLEQKYKNLQRRIDNGDRFNDII